MAIDQSKVDIALLQSHEVGDFAFISEQEKIPVANGHRFTLQGIDERNRQIVLRILSTPTTPSQGVRCRCVQ